MPLTPGNWPGIALVFAILPLTACQAESTAEPQIQPKTQTVKPDLPGPAQALVGRVYQWVVTYPEQGSPVRPEHPSDYQLRFASADRISLKADCNQYAGPVRLTNSVFSVGTLIGTRALCPKGSLEGVFVKAIEDASGWRVEGNDLVLTLPHDGGAMHLEWVKVSGR